MPLSSNFRSGSDALLKDTAGAMNVHFRGDAYEQFHDRRLQNLLLPSAPRMRAYRRLQNLCAASTAADRAQLTWKCATAAARTAWHRSLTCCTAKRMTSSSVGEVPSLPYGLTNDGAWAAVISLNNKRTHCAQWGGGACERPLPHQSLTRSCSSTAGVTRTHHHHVLRCCHQRPKVSEP